MLQIDIAQFLTQESIAKQFETLPALFSPVMDAIYPEARRRVINFPYVSVNEIQVAIKNISLSKRGSNPTPIYGEDQSITMIEVQPFRPSERVNAKEINDLKLMPGGMQNVEGYVTGKLNKLRNAIRISSEALCAQSLTGALSYPIAMNGSYGTYSVNFGSTLAYTPTTLWNASTITASAIMMNLADMETKIQETSNYGADVEFWAGKKAFADLAKVVESSMNDGRYDGKVGKGEITLNGYTVKLMNRQYMSDIAAGTYTPVVADNKIVAIAKDAPTELIYAAVDDLSAGLIGTPFAAKQVIDERQNSIEIIAESKPLPVPYVKGICWATVTSL